MLFGGNEFKFKTTCRLKLFKRLLYTERLHKLQVHIYIITLNKSETVQDIFYCSILLRLNCTILNLTKLSTTIVRTTITPMSTSLFDILLLNVDG